MGINAELVALLQLPYWQKVATRYGGVKAMPHPYYCMHVVGAAHPVSALQFTAYPPAYTITPLQQ